MPADKVIGMLIVVLIVAVSCGFFAGGFAAVGVLTYNRLVHPLRVRAWYRLPSRPRIDPLDLGDADRDVADFFREQVAALRPLGFEPPAYYISRESTPDVTAHYAYLVNRENSVMASAVAWFLSAGGPTGCSLSFDNRYSSDTHVITSNDNAMPFYALPDGTVLTQVPSVRDPAELYSLHLAVLAEVTPAGAPVCCQPGREIEYLREVDHDPFYEEQVRRGLFHYDDALAAHTLTLRGAYRLVWGELWPLKGVRARRMRREERRVLAEFRAAHDNSPSDPEATRGLP
jgi:hypothetical protein